MWQSVDLSPAATKSFLRRSNDVSWVYCSFKCVRDLRLGEIIGASSYHLWVLLSTVSSCTTGAIIITFPVADRTCCYASRGACNLVRNKRVLTPHNNWIWAFLWSGCSLTALAPTSFYQLWPYYTCASSSKYGSASKQTNKRKNWRWQHQLVPVFPVLIKGRCAGDMMSVGVFSEKKWIIDSSCGWAKDKICSIYQT